MSKRLKNPVIYSILFFFFTGGCSEKKSELTEEDKPSYRVFYPNIDATAEGVLELNLERVYGIDILVFESMNGDTLIDFNIQAEDDSGDKILLSQSWRIPVPSKLDELKEFLWDEYWVYIIGYGNLTDENIEDAIALSNARTGEYFVGFYEREVIEDTLKAYLTVQYRY